MRRILRFFWPQGRWRWFYRAGLFFFIFSIVSVEVTSQSGFCNSCHIMHPYYRSWSTGTHKSVGCVSCHIPPGMKNLIFAKLNGAGQVVDDLLERTSSKPSAVVSDSACTRSGCHAIEKVRAVSRRKGKYFFDHAKHLGLDHKGIEIHCTTCHSHVKGENHFEVNTNACITCHLAGPPTVPAAAPVRLASLKLEPGQLAATRPAEAIAGALETKIPPQACRNCHEPPEKPIQYHGMKVVHSEYLSYGAACESCHMGVTEKPKPVRDEACFSCHEFGIEKLGAIPEMHRVHSSGRHKVECFSCHGVVRHGPSAQSMQLDHIECQACHRGQHAIQQTTYKALPDSHQPKTETGAVSPMFMVHVGCTGCHVDTRPLRAKPDTGATVASASVKACDACHQHGLGDKMVPLWQKNTHTLFDATMRMLPAPSRELSPKAKQAVAEAKSLLELVRLDGSWGVHNPRYTQKLLEEAQGKLAEIQPAPTTMPVPSTMPAGRGTP